MGPWLNFMDSRQPDNDEYPLTAALDPVKTFQKFFDAGLTSTTKMANGKNAFRVWLRTILHVNKSVFEYREKIASKIFDMFWDSGNVRGISKILTKKDFNVPIKDYIEFLGIVDDIYVRMHILRWFGEKGVDVDLGLHLEKYQPIYWEKNPKLPRNFEDNVKKSIYKEILISHYKYMIEGDLSRMYDETEEDIVSEIVQQYTDKLYKMDPDNYDEYIDIFIDRLNEIFKEQGLDMSI
jgi:hypothetical protein